MSNRAFASFANWTDLQDHIRAGNVTYYHAPMDYAPVRIVARVRDDGWVRVGGTCSADPFTCDAEHLSRFRREEGRS